MKRLGAETLSTDAVNHDVLAGEEMRDVLVARWGEEIAPNGSVDRDAVASVVFENPDELQWLESELHPRIGRAVAEWRAGLDPSTEVAVIEVPLLFETGLEAAFDDVLAVVAADEIRNERLAERGDAGLEGREERQLSQDEKASRAGYVVRNEGSIDDLERELAAILAEQ
ncbi:MAG: dephospho-CoA kinase [Solirubrobacterales bacterium]|nr:dephospho-CoA kinase [Solirubrobacterales bacterium]